MPVKKNLGLAAEMGEEIDVTEEQAIEASTPKQVVAPPPAPVTLTFEQLKELLGARQDNTDLINTITTGIAQARQPIKEGTDASYHRISAINPLGERDHPKPLLKHAITLGIAEPKSGAIQRTYPFEQDDLTVYEVCALNTLPESGEYIVNLYDGAPIKVSLVSTRNAATDEVVRTTIVIPNHVTQKGSQIKNMLPGALGLVEQITGVNFAKKSHEEMAVLMAAHREKRYASAAA